MALQPLRRLFKRIGAISSDADDAEWGNEKGAAWYDDAYAAAANGEYGKHYSQSRYYFVWTVIADRIPLDASVLEIGCGTGQFAQLLSDRPVRRYVGFDFSQEAVRRAKARAPNLEFNVANALTTDLLRRSDYSIVVCTEVLEHIEADLEVVSRIRSGVRCLMTVPNFPYESHVRHFESAAQVSSRYGPFFSDLRVDWFLMNPEGDGFFLSDGVRNAYVSTASRSSAIQA